MPKRAEIKSGDRFGDVVVISEAEPNITPCGTKQRAFMCRCFCGKVYRTGLQTLLHSKKHNCGCDMKHEVGDGTRKYTDEERKSWLYSTWRGMIQRCYDKNSSSYKNYGGRGVSICDEWRNDYLAFYRWAISSGAKKSLTIDRIDTNGNYCPDNCRWATATEQARNTRLTRKVFFDGMEISIRDLAEKFGVNFDAFRGRLNSGHYTIEEAVGLVKHEVKRSKRPNKRKAVLQFSIDGTLLREWSSAYEISESLRIPMKSIGNCCRGVYRSAHGYVWKYKDGVSVSSCHRREMKPVEQYDCNGNLVAKYDSLRSASLATGIPIGGISKFCRKHHHSHCGGYFWKYSGTDVKVVPFVVRRTIKNNNTND
jgi:hypothetical protein